MKQGQLAVISGFSGVGKGTVIRELIRRNPEYHYSVSATTRAPRPGEVDGREYFFLTQEEFDAWEAAGAFLEHARYASKCYGTPREYVRRQREMGFHVVMDIETDGAFQVKRSCPDAILILLIPPSAADLKERLVGRGTENREQVIARLLKAQAESKLAERYDWLVINDDVERCAQVIHRIVNGCGRPEEDRATCLEIVKQISLDLPKILKSL